MVVPSIPGFGFSTPVRDAGWTTGRTARALVELLSRLGYQRYGIHGGDIGAGVAGGMSPIDPERVVRVHVTSDPRVLPSSPITLPEKLAHSSARAGNNMLNAERHVTDGFV
jgi:pimeloyl-ACP methyl ester carboxylesterase